MSSRSRSHSPCITHPCSVQEAVTDERRLQAFRRYDVLGTEPEPAFDRLTDLATHLFEAPVSVISFVAEDYQWLKSTIGFDAQKIDLDVSFCVYTVAAGGLFVVENLAADERFADNPYVVEHGIRFYAGAPLTTPEGHHIGTICVLDTEPHSPSEAALARLSDLAAMVMDELELRREHAERKRTAERLRQSQQLLRQTQQLAHVGGWEYDLQTNALSWTEETYRIHGLASDVEIDVQEAIAFYVPEARPIIESHLESIREEGGRFDLELQIMTAEGERRWVRTIGRAHREEGEIVRLSGAIQDITEQRQAEEERRKQEEMLQTIVDNIPVVIALFNEEGRLQLVNQEFEDVLGWTSDEVGGPSRTIDLFEPDSDDQRKVQRFIEDAPGRWQEFQARRKEGTTVDLLGTVVKLRDGGRIGIGVDVSEKKERKKRLRLLEAAVEHTRVPILITEAEPLDDPGPRIQYANPAFTDVSGYDVEEVQGRNPRFLQGEDTDRQALDRLRAGLERKEPVREIVRNYTKEGTPYWNDIYIAPVPDENGEVTHFVSIQADVTERIEQRQELREAKDAAEEADRIKTALLSNMNHEFRTPLTSIISFSRLIRDTPELAEDFADRILGGGKRLLHTLNAVMDFAELEAGDISSTTQRLELKGVATSVADTFQDLASRKELALEVDAPGSTITAVLDKHVVERVLTHLVSNAVKFTEEGGATIRIRQREGAVELSVEDTGIGIPVEAQPRVFDEFYQASTGNNRTHDGNGLGLTIVKRTLDRVGGTIDLQSTPGEGTTVTVRLPTGEGTR